MQRSILWMVLGVLTMASTASAQSFVVDLSEPAGARVRLPVTPGTRGGVKVINRVPLIAYDVSINLSPLKIDPLPAPTLAAAPPDFCTDTSDFATKTLKAATTEASVANAVKDLRSKVESCPPATHERVSADLEARVEALTVRTYDAVTVGSGEELTIVVQRKGEKAGEKLVWTVVYATVARGNWSVVYGFTFSPDRNQLFATKASGSSFEIIRQDDVKGALTYTPAVFYTWMPTSREHRDFAFGLTGGVGLDSTGPAVFLGGIVTFNQNLGVVVGLTGQKEKRLLGNYNVGDQVKEALTADQLSQQRFLPNGFVGLVLRFGTNPFASGDKAKDAKGKTP